MLDDRHVTYDELRARRRRAVRPPRRPARCSRATWCILLGRHSIEAAVALLGCLHRGVVLAPLPPMFNAAQLAALARQTRREGARRLRRRRRRSPSASRSPATVAP